MKDFEGEWKEMKQAVCLLIEEENKVLSVSRKNGKGFGLIGGKVEEQDLDLKAAIRREALEEASLEVES